jgi:hypothetical protein
MPDAERPRPAPEPPTGTATVPGRRGILRALAGLPLLAATTPPGLPPLSGGAEPFPQTVRMLVAGPQHGRLEGWSNAIAPALAQALPPNTVIRCESVGGADGVTAANQFETRVAPDGATVLLLPGAAGMAWLVGDPRARYDVARWLPVMAGVTAGVVASRIAPDALAAGKELRIAASTPGGRDLPALLGIDLLGMVAAPVFNLQEPEAAMAALAGHAVDAVFLTGPRVADQLAALASSGVRPLFSFGLPDERGTVVRDLLLPGIPSLPELAARLRGAPPSGPLYTAWRATAAAAQLEFAVALPRLTPASIVALWRRAGMQAVASPAVLAASGSGVRPLATPAATASAASMAADPASLLELRRWLAARFNWQPS